MFKAEGIAGTKIPRLAMRSERRPEARSCRTMARTLNFSPGVIGSH